MKIRIIDGINNDSIERKRLRVLCPLTTVGKYLVIAEPGVGKSSLLKEYIKIGCENKLNILVLVFEERLSDVESYKRLKSEVADGHFVFDIMSVHTSLGKNKSNEKFKIINERINKILKKDRNHYDLICIDSATGLYNILQGYNPNKSPLMKGGINYDNALEVRSFINKLAKFKSGDVCIVSTLRKYARSLNYLYSCLSANSNGEIFLSKEVLDFGHFPNINIRKSFIREIKDIDNGFSGIHNLLNAA